MTQLGRSRFLSAVVLLVFLAGSVPLPAGAEVAVPAPDANMRIGAEPDRAVVPDTSAASRAVDPLGDGQSAPPAGDPTASLDQARELIKAGDYDGAIGILKAAVERERARIPVLRDVYLLLIKSYVYLGNDLKLKPQGRETSSLNYQEARRLIAACLRTEELRHVRPEPVSEYPEEMIRFFAEIRGQIFGSFRVLKLEPPGAIVLLDADTLRTLAADGLLGDVDIAVGPHLVVVRAKGYKDLTEEIAISPSSTLERSYGLSRRHGAAWYASVGAGAAAVVGGAIALAAGGSKSDGTPPPEPLPGPPGPPSTP